MSRRVVDPERLMPQWVRPEEPEIIGLVVRVLYPGEPDRDDGRRWTHEGPGRWALLRNGMWFWEAVLGVTGGVVAVGFACQTCHGKMSESVADVRDGYCGHCHAQTGTAQGRAIHAALIEQGEATS